MKTIISLAFILMFHLHAFGQPQIVLSGGYTFGKVADGGPQVGGYKFSGTFERIMPDEHWAIGGTFGYMAVTESEGPVGTRFSALPLLFTPKYFVGKGKKYSDGKGKAKGYIKGAFGLQNSRFKFDTPIGASQDWDFGLVYGGGVGVNYDANEKVFINFEYEYLLINNSAYKSVTCNTFAL